MHRLFIEAEKDELAIFQKLKMEAIFWMARRQPHCKDITTWMSERMERELDWRRRITLKLHKMICEWCKRYDEQLRFLRSAVRDYSMKIEEAPTSPPVLSPEARERLKQALNKKRD